MKMKRNIFFLASVLSMIGSGCSTNAVDEVSTEPSGTTTIGVSTESTRTYLGDKTEGVYSVLWAEGDKISVNGIESGAVAAQYVGKTYATFAVESAVAPYSVVYPASAVADGNVVLSPTQTYSSAQFDSGSAILVGYSETNDVKMVNACAYLKIVISRADAENLASLRLYTRNEEPISGKFSVNYSTSALTPAGDNTNAVEISLEGSIPYDVSGKASVILALPAGTYAKGFAVSASTKENNVMNKYAYGSGKTLEAGKMYPMDELTYASTFSGGNGTAEYPYLISTKDDVKLLSSVLADPLKWADYCDKYYLQTADINMESAAPSSTRGAVETLIPIGPSTTLYFGGEYDGGGYSISNFNVDVDDTCGGLFGYLNNSAVIKNLTVDSATIHADKNNAGAIAGGIKLATVDNCYVKNCTISCDSYYCGGVVGYHNYGGITNCTVDDKTTVTGLYHVGGIIGCIYVGGTLTYTLDGCSSLASVKATGADSDGYSGLGGIVGYVYAKTASMDDIKNCLFDGTIVSAAGNGIGGIVGYVITKANVKHRTVVASCTNKSAITTDKLYVGGIVGSYLGLKSATLPSLTIDQCVSNADITGGSRTGGLLGFANVVYGPLNITSCRVAGNITSAGEYAAGVSSSVTIYGPCTVDGCAVYGNTTGKFGVAGVLGYAGTKAAAAELNIVNTCYFGKTVETTGNNGSNGYTLGGGIIGWAQSSYGSINIVNCASRVQELKYVSIYATYESKVRGEGGILGGPTGSVVNISGCYSTIGLSGFICDGTAVTAMDTGLGGINGTGVTKLTVSKSYYNPDVNICGSTNGTYSNNETCSSAADYLAKMNAFVSSYQGGLTLSSWVAGTDGYPVPDGMTDTDADLK